MTVEPVIRAPWGEALDRESKAGPHCARTRQLTSQANRERHTVSSATPGRHRAPGRLSLAPLLRVTTVAAASGGLALSMAGTAQATPAQVPAQPVAPAAAVSLPATLPTALGSVASSPVFTHPTTSGWSTLRWGSRGGKVSSVQRIVGASADGVFGPRTHAAVKRWQARQDLVADGIVGPITSRAMGLSTSSSRSSTSSTSSNRSSSSASRSSSRSSSAAAVLPFAQQYTGIMYRWGGTSPSTGFDCSGYTQYVYAKIGISLPRTAEQQRQASTPVSSPRPGDLVFWGAPAYHNAIYAGDGMIYDSGRAGLPTQKRKMFSGVTSYGRVG